MRINWPMIVQFGQCKILAAYVFWENTFFLQGSKSSQPVFFQIFSLPEQCLDPFTGCTISNSPQKLSLASIGNKLTMGCLCARKLTCGPLNSGLFFCRGSLSSYNLWLYSPNGAFDLTNDFQAGSTFFIWSWNYLHHPQFFHVIFLPVAQAIALEPLTWRFISRFKKLSWNLLVIFEVVGLNCTATRQQKNCRSRLQTRKKWVAFSQLHKEIAPTKSLFISVYHPVFIWFFWSHIPLMSYDGAKL